MREADEVQGKELDSSCATPASPCGLGRFPLHLVRYEMRTVMAQRLAHSECRIDSGPIPAVVTAECRPSSLQWQVLLLICWLGRVGDGDSKEVQILETWY